MRSVLEKPQIVTIELSGYISAANVNELQQQLSLAVKSSEYALLVDMTKVDLLDSAGLMALISAFKLAQNTNKRLCICSLAPAVQMIFELTQLDRVFEIFDNRHAFELSLK